MVSRNNGPRLIEMFEQYHTGLKGRFDFTLLQAGFLDFLNNSESLPFTKGVSGNEARPGVEHVIVDEYQDSNPIQERIYFTLAKQSNATGCWWWRPISIQISGRQSWCSCAIWQTMQCLWLPLPAKLNLENRRSHKLIVLHWTPTLTSNSRADLGLLAAQNQP